MLADHHVFIVSLMLSRLFIHTQVKEPRPVEQLDHLSDEISADSIVQVR